MDETTALSLLGDIIDDQGCMHGEVTAPDDAFTVSLSGTFSVEQLEAVVWWVKLQQRRAAN